MKRLHDRIRAKSENFAERPITIVVFGDSITMGAFEEGVFDFESVYHNRLKKILGSYYPNTVFNIINSGVAGQTATEALERIQRDIVDYEPDLTLVAFGMNDSNAGMEGLDLFRSSINSIVQNVKANTESEIVLVTPSFKPYDDNFNVKPIHKNLVQGFVNDQRNGVLKSYARVICEIAVENDINVADVYGVWESLRDKGVQTDELLANGLNHPIRQMHQVVADLIAELIISDFKSTPVEEILADLK